MSLILSKTIFLSLYIASQNSKPHIFVVIGMHICNCHWLRILIVGYIIGGYKCLQFSAGHQGIDPYLQLSTQFTHVDFSLTMDSKQIFVYLRLYF